MDRGTSVREELAGEPMSARDARRIVVRTLRQWRLDHLEDSATLLVSEVVTNAVLHARTGLALALELRADTVRVTVSDGSPSMPARRRHSLEAATGRGLGLLTTLSVAWGTEPGSAPWRKDVWFELPTDPAALPDPGEAAL